MKKRIIINLVIFCLAGNLYAQKTLRADTLTGIFDKRNNHKDGYEFSHSIIVLPDRVALLCDKKQTRIIGLNNTYAIEHSVPENDTIPIQGRYEYVAEKNDSGKLVAERRLVPTGSNFNVISVSVWDKFKKKWMLVLNPEINGDENQ